MKIKTILQKAKAIIHIIIYPHAWYVTFTGSPAYNEEITAQAMLTAARQLHAKYLISDTLMRRIEEELQKEWI